MDKVKVEQNGSLTFTSYNIKSRLGELRLLDYLSGDVEGLKPPEPYTTQKVRDWLTYFLISVKRLVQDGTLAKEPDYYMWEAASLIGSFKDELCGEPVTITGCDTPIELLDVAVFDARCQTYIASLKPSLKKPIAKSVGKNFEFLPVDLGSVKITYKRLPVFGEIKTTIDTVYNIEIPDPATSIPYEWPEFARPLLTWFIAQQYSVSNREKALTEQLLVEGKTVRG